MEFCSRICFLESNFAKYDQRVPGWYLARRKAPLTHLHGCDGRAEELPSPTRDELRLSGFSSVRIGAITSLDTLRALARRLARRACPDPALHVGDRAHGRRPEPGVLREVDA